MKKYQLNQGFITQKIENKTTIFQGEESILLTLNETAAYIFNGLKLNWEKDKIADGLVKKFNVTKSEALKDIEEFTGELVKRKILSLV